MKRRKLVVNPKTENQAADTWLFSCFFAINLSVLPAHVKKETDT